VKSAHIPQEEEHAPKLRGGGRCIWASEKKRNGSEGGREGGGVSGGGALQRIPKNRKEKDPYESDRTNRQKKKKSARHAGEKKKGNRRFGESALESPNLLVADRSKKKI